jgi:hypothetical protein
MMGNAMFFYFPLPDARSLVTIDLGEGLGELFSEYEYDVAQSISRGGRRYLSHGLQREFVTIQRDRMISSTTSAEEKAMRLQSMQNHLDRGGYVSFCADSDKAYIHPILNTAEQGFTSLLLGSNPFKYVTGANLPTVNDYVTIQTDSPTSIIEHKSIKVIDGSFSSTTGGSITASPDIVYTYPERAFLRYYRFWPTLRRDSRDIGQNIITNEGGRLFSLNIRLYLDTFTLFNFHSGFDGINKSANFKNRDVPSASGGENPFSTIGSAVEFAPAYMQRERIKKYNDVG